MNKFRSSSGDREPPSSNFARPQDCFDQAIAEILSKDSSSAYSIISAIERTIRQFKLNTEAHGLLFDAYLCGKKALSQGKEIRNPMAWLKGTAYNLAREQSRKGRKTHAFAPDLIDMIFPDEGDNPLDYAILEEEIAAVIQAVAQLRAEKPETFLLIHQRVVEGLSWQEIVGLHNQDHLAAEVTEEALRQRFSRGRKYLRSIFHEVMMA